MNTKETKPEAKAGYTPGPWKVASSVNHIGVTVWRSDGDGVNYERICRNVSTPANARLIAAAPELLAACERALDYIELVSGKGPGSGLKQSLRDAIADAKGATT